MSAIARIEVLLGVDSLLTPEDIELRQTVRRFGEQRLRPHVADWFEAGEVRGPLDWILNGSKTWITNGTVADVAIVGETSRAPEDIVGFGVPAGTPGFSARDMMHNKRNHPGASGDSARHRPRVGVDPRRHVGGAPDGYR